MAAARDKVFAAALALPPRERAELISELAETLVPLTPEEEDGLLLGLRQIDDGKTVSGESFFGEMRTIVGAAPALRRKRPRK